MEQLFSSTGNGSTTIKGDTIKTTNLIVNGKDIGGVATDVAGIERNTENEDGLGYYTQIEGKQKYITQVVFLQLMVIL